MVFHLLFFLVAALLLGISAYFGTRGRFSDTGDLRREGPARIADSLRRRNRLWMLVTLAIVVVVAVVELLVAPLHDALLDLQFDMGGSGSGSLDAAMGGISWGLYLALLVGAVVGIVAGTLGALRGISIAGQIGARDIL